MPQTRTAIVRVRTYELDSFGHVNNAVYLNYLEEARSEYLRQMGLSFHDFARLGVHLVIVESHVNYLTPVFYGDVIEIAGEFTNVRAASVKITYRLTEQKSQRLVATAWTIGAFMNPGTGRPVRAPAAFRAAFLGSAVD